jgi:hypothetical protein
LAQRKTNGYIRREGGTQGEGRERQKSAKEQASEGEKGREREKERESERKGGRGTVGDRERETGLIKHTGFLDNMRFVNALERSLHLCARTRKKEPLSTRSTTTAGRCVDLSVKICKQEGLGFRV